VSLITAKTKSQRLLNLQTFQVDKNESITKTIADIAQTLTIFAFPVFGDCTEMNNGSKCLVQNAVTTVDRSDEKIPFDFDKVFAAFLRDFFGKILW